LSSVKRPHSIRLGGQITVSATGVVGVTGKFVQRFAKELAAHTAARVLTVHKDYLRSPALSSAELLALGAESPPKVVLPLAESVELQDEVSAATEFVGQLSSSAAPAPVGQLLDIVPETVASVGQLPLSETVTEVADALPEPPDAPPAEPQAPGLEDMTRPELIDFLGAHGVEVKEIRMLKKAELLEKAKALS
jgi:hypothetical protein